MTLRKIQRSIVYLLLLTLIANFLNLAVAPKYARAADPNMYLFWVGTCSDGAMPAGWTLVSDGGTEEFNNMFPRGNTSYSARVKTTDTHTHTGTGASIASGAGGYSGAGSTVFANQTHTHAVTVDSVSSTSSLPAYKNMCVIKYSGIPTTIPQDAVAIFDTTFSGSWPTNWEDYSSTYRNGSDRFIRGGADTTTTGGNNTHASTGHSVSATLGTVTGTISTGGIKSLGSLSSHTHTASLTSDTPDTQPKYITVVLGRATATATIPAHMIAMFDGSSFSSYGWETVSDNGDDFYQRFPKVTGTYGTTGGADTHTHSQLSGTSSTHTPASNNVGIVINGVQTTHSHTTTVDLAVGTDTNIPPYTDVVFAKKSYVYTTLTTDKASYDAGDTVTINSAFDNYSASNLTNTKLDYVTFIDSDADNFPDVGETYVTATCAGSDTIATNLLTTYTEYTLRTTGKTVNAGAQGTDAPSCTNDNFPGVNDYVVWSKWYDTGATLIYDTKYVGFHSVPTLTEIMFLVFIGCAVFIGIKKGIIKIKPSGNKLKNRSKDVISNDSEKSHQIATEIVTFPRNDKIENHQPFDNFRPERSRKGSRSIDSITHRKRDHEQ